MLLVQSNHFVSIRVSWTAPPVAINEGAARPPTKRLTIFPSSQLMKTGPTQVRQEKKAGILITHSWSSTIIQCLSRWSGSWVRNSSGQRGCMYQNPNVYFKPTLSISVNITSVSKTFVATETLIPLWKSYQSCSFRFLQSRTRTGLDVLISISSATQRQTATFGAADLCHIQRCANPTQICFSLQDLKIKKCFKVVIN